MAARNCQLCDERPADLLVSMTATGEAEWVCLPCMPGRLADYFAAHGVPGLIFDFEEQPEQQAPEPDPEPTLESDTNGAGGGTKRGRKVPAAVEGGEAPAPSNPDD